MSGSVGLPVKEATGAILGRWAFLAVRHVPCAGVAGTQSAAMLTTEMEPLVRISGSQGTGTEESVGKFGSCWNVQWLDDFIVNEPQDLGFSVLCLGLSK